VRVCGAGVIDQDDADVLAGNAADDLSIALEDKLVELDGQMGRLARDFHGPLDHGPRE
jgi:hypothetical protein